MMGHVIDDDLLDRITEALDVDRGVAERVAAAAWSLWSALEAEGMVDTFGGAETRRVLPDALRFIRGHSNAPPIPPWDPDPQGGA